MGKIIIVADSGHFKAFRLSSTPQKTPRIELVESFDILDGHGKLSDKVTDSAGQFGTSGRKAFGTKGFTTGHGEAHSMATETERKIIKNITKSIGDILKKEKCEVWFLAAEKSINSQIIEQLDPALKASLEKNLSANLTKADKAEILKKFI